MRRETKAFAIVFLVSQGRDVAGRWKRESSSLILPSKPSVLGAKVETEQALAPRDATGHGGSP